MGSLAEKTLVIIVRKMTPTRKDLPAIVTDGTVTTSVAIMSYIRQLEDGGFTAEAATIGTLYEQLVHGNWMGLPRQAWCTTFPNGKQTGPKPG